MFFEMFGVLGIYLALRDGPSERLAFWGLAAFLAHVAQGHALFALLYFMFPALGTLFLAGVESAPGHAVVEGQFAAFMVFGLLTWWVGSFLLALAIRRSSVLPRWSGFVMLAGFVLVLAPGMVAQLTANLVWGAAFAWMAWAVWSSGPSDPE